MDEDSFKKTMIIQLSQYIVYGAWLSTKVAEYTHCRAVSQRVSNNSFVRKCILSFNQNRQALLTQKVMELMSMEYSMS
jgi:F0F1-type ATP synthase gamma subunit